LREDAGGLALAILALSETEGKALNSSARPSQGERNRQI